MREGPRGGTGGVGRRGAGSLHSSSSRRKEEGRKNNCSPVKCKDPRQPQPCSWQSTLPAPRSPHALASGTSTISKHATPMRASPHCFLRLHSTSSFRLLGHGHWATDSSPGRASFQCFPSAGRRTPPESLLRVAQRFVLIETHRHPLSPPISHPQEKQKNQTITEIKAVKSYKSES